MLERCQRICYRMCLEICQMLLGTESERDTIHVLVDVLHTYIHTKRGPLIPHKWKAACEMIFCRALALTLTFRIAAGTTKPKQPQKEPTQERTRNEQKTKKNVENETPSHRRCPGSA